MTNRNMSCSCIGNLLLPRQYLVLHWPPLFASPDQRQHKFTDILNSIYHTRIYTQKSRYSEINHTKIHRNSQNQRLSAVSVFFLFFGDRDPHNLFPTRPDQQNLVKNSPESIYTFRTMQTTAASFVCWPQ